MASILHDKYAIATAVYLLLILQTQSHSAHNSSSLWSPEWPVVAGNESFARSAVQHELDTFKSFRSGRIKRHYYSSDTHLTAPELLESRGYPVEIHHVYSQSGYVLELHRVPRPGRPVVVAFHGMFQSSRDFLMNADGRNFAHVIADAGYDLWLANARGNFYSDGHLFLSRKSSKYWYYSVDEIIREDIPAMIDYVLKTTGQPRLNWVGYSLGSAVMFGLLSTQDEYNDKINLYVSMGTTAYIGHTVSPVIRILAPTAYLQDKIITLVNHGEYLPSFLFPIMRKLFPLFCTPEAAIDKVGLCGSFLFLIGGFSPAQANPKVLPIMLGGTPNSVSVKQLSQWYQWINNGALTHYDYGKKENFQRYGQSRPPAYNLHQVRAKTAIIWAENDWLAPPKDVQRTASELPNLVANIKVKSRKFSHLDFLYGKDADIYAYHEVVKLLRLYN